MAGGLTVRLFGDRSPLKRELDASVAEARRAGQNMQAALANARGESARSGVISEIVVLGREFSRGNFSRMPGSITLLAQRMGLLNLIVKDSSTSARLLANAYGELSVKASGAAVAATRKAAASMEAFNADASDTEATMESALADGRKATAARLASFQIMQKARASNDAALAAETEAGATKTSIGVLGTLIGVLTGVAVGALAANKLVKNLTETLAGVKEPDFDPKTILNRQSKEGAPEEIQREINVEITKSIDLYNSAAEAAERVTKATSEHYKNQRELLDIQKQTELAKTKNVKEKQGIEDKYAKKEFDLNVLERADTVNNMVNERGALRTESLKKQQEATRLSKSVGPAQADENALGLAEARLAKTKAAEDVINKSKADPGFLNLFNSRDVFRAYNAVAATGVSGSDLDAAERTVTTDRIAQEKNVRRLKEQKDAHDLIRDHAKELTSQAGESAAKAETVNLQITQTKKDNESQTNDEAALLEAKYKLNAAKSTLPDVKVGREATAREKIGLGAPEIALVNVNQQQLRAQQQQLAVAQATLKAIANMKPNHNPAEDGKF